MKQIEAAIVANAGIYPEREGRINLQEVLRVAKLSPASLEKARHAATKQKVQAWLLKIHQREATSASKVRKLVTERADAADDRVKEIMQVWHEAELEYHEHRIELAKTIEENDRLRAEVARLRVEAAGEKVVAIPSKKGER